MSSATAAGYHDGEALDAAVARLVDLGGDRTELCSLGESVEGRPIPALTVAAPGTAPDPDRAHAVIIGTIHGNEVVASEVALALATRLVERPPPLLDGADVTVVPVVNPDSRARSLASVDGAWWRLSPRTNANGVDLNRNWPWARGASAHWLPWAGSDRPWLPWYRGPAPCSEPEVRALSGLFERRPPSVLANLHSVGEIVTYPWSSFDRPADHAAELAAMAAAFNDALARPAGFRAKQSNAWYPIVGSSNDHVYDAYGTFAVTIELSTLGAAVKARWSRAPRPFWWSNPDDPAACAAEVTEPCLAAVAAGLASHPSGSEAPPELA